MHSSSPIQSVYFSLLPPLLLLFLLTFLLPFLLPHIPTNRSYSPHLPRREVQQVDALREEWTSLTELADSVQHQLLSEQRLSYEREVDKQVNNGVCCCLFVCCLFVCCLFVVCLFVCLFLYYTRKLFLF